MVTRMTLTRAELIAAHMAMNFLRIEYGLERDPEAEPLLSALMKFYYAVRTWDGEDTVKLVCVAGENTSSNKHVKIGAATAKAKVKMEVLVHWRCFCKAPTESCSFCRGRGHLERWMPAKLLAYLKGGSFSIVARRKVRSWWKVPQRPKT
jgi:hypothetical protein